MLMYDENGMWRWTEWFEGASMYVAIATSFLGVCCWKANGIKTNAKQPGQEAHKPLQFLHKIMNEKHTTSKVNAFIQVLNCSKNIIIIKICYNFISFYYKIQLEAGLWCAPASTWNYSANLLSDSLVGLVDLNELLTINSMGLENFD